MGYLIISSVDTEIAALCSNMVIMFRALVFKSAEYFPYIYMYINLVCYLS